jgi:hypothetical protein
MRPSLPAHQSIQRLFVVSKSDVSNFGAWARPAPVSLKMNEVNLSIDRFAFTANNMTYANAGGPPLNYWKFYDHLTRPDLEKRRSPRASKWGCIPVWGVATVKESRNRNVREGDRYYGFFPMADSVTFEPSKASEAAFTVPRYDPDLAAVYNTYVNTATDAFYTGPSNENSMCVYRPLFLTSFMLDDYCKSIGDAVTQVLITSASSKTSFSLAYMLKKRGVPVVGLTSSKNKSFAQNLRLYDKVCAYDEISDIATAKSVVVDVAGSHAVNVELDCHFGESLLRNIGVGLTHNTVTSCGQDELSDHARATREFFFAPKWIKKRMAEDPTIVSEKAANAYENFVAESDNKSWLTYEASEGIGKWGMVYEMFSTDGKNVPPTKAYILS